MSTEEMTKLKAYIKERHEAAQFIDWSQDIEVLMSGAGYCIGMKTADGEPMCRLSTEYFATEEEANDALLTYNFGLRLWA